MNYSDGFEEIIKDSVDTSLDLLKSETPKYFEKLKVKVGYMLSCSRLEDHWNIWYTLSNVEPIIDSLLTGHKMTIDIKNILSECLLSVRSDVVSGRQDVNTEINTALRKVLDEIKRNEKDYIYDRNLRCLVISSDKFLCNLITNSTDGSLDITIVENVRGLFERDLTTEFDIVVCNIIEKDILMNDFIISFSKRIPMVAICRPDNSQLIMNAAKVGVKYLVTADTFGIRFLSKTIHTAYSEWVKDMKRFSLRPVLENHFTRLVLRDMLLTELPIQQKIKSHFANELEINSVIKDSYDIKANEIIKSDFLPIDLLVKDKYLLKKKIKSTVVCPNCRSVDLDITYSCTKCKNVLFERYTEGYSHQKCGFHGLRNAFIVGKRFYCPSCRESISDFQSLKKESFFKCVACEEMFQTPKLKFKCNFCEFGPFEPIEGDLQTLFKFDLNPLLEKQFKKHFLILERLGVFLQQSGFIVSYDERPSDNLQSEIYYDLVAQKEDSKIIVVILSSTLEHNIELLYHIEYLKIDGNNIFPIIVSLSEPNRLILNLLIKHKMFNIISDDGSVILKSSKEYLNLQ
jgi:hypothetical protein